MGSSEREGLIASLFWVSDSTWAAIEPHLPHDQPGKPRVDDRRVVSGILLVLKTGCRWRDVPAAYGPATTIYNRYNRWSKRRIWQRIFEKMAASGPVPEELAIDSSSRHTARLPDQKGGIRGSNWALARRKNKQNPCSGDDLGRPVAFALTPGNVADIAMAVPLLETVARPKRLLADKAYDANRLRSWLRTQKVKAVIPSTATRYKPYPLDRKAYRRRNVIERMFCKLKTWRRVATRYDRLARNYLSAVALAALFCGWI
jgi:transposase